MTCRCANLQKLWDEEAKAYIQKHLIKVEVRADGWEIVYRCPDTGLQWLRDYPHSERHGGGPMRLRRIE
ncbi:MAG: Imm27 family immunity protein [Methylococcales bacterium]